MDKIGSYHQSMIGASILPWVCICKRWKEWSNVGLQDAKKASSASCLALRDAHCGKLSKQEASRSSCLHCHLCHKRCQSTPPHRATCGRTGGRARGNLRPWAGASLFCAATVSLLMYVPSTGSKFWGPASASVSYRSGSGSAQLGPSVQDGPGVEAAGSDAKLLQELGFEQSSWGAFTRCNCPGNPFQKGSWMRLPSCSGFSDQRGELNTVGTAHLSSLQVRHFCSCVCRGGGQGLSRRRTESLLPQGGREGQVKRSRRAKVRWHKQVSWPSSSRALFFRSLREEQACLLFLRL